MQETFLQNDKSWKISNGVRNWSTEAATYENSETKIRHLGFNELAGIPLLIRNFVRVKEHMITYRFVNFPKFPIAGVSDPVKPGL